MSTDPRQQDLGLRETTPIKRVEDFEFEPIQGYPMLRWKGKRPFTSTQYYPAQHKETYGLEVNGWRNKIYWGDNLQVMSHLLKEYRRKITLVYIDPPFDSKAEYKRKVSVRGREAQNDQSIFEEKQYSDIWINDEYLQFMYERLILIKELLSDNGSIYLHCDTHKIHHLRCIMDEIFGADRFTNQIIWKRSDAHSDVGQGAKHLGAIHDILLLYRKGEDIVWNPYFNKLPDSTVEKWYRNIEPETGRLYNKADITGPGGAAKGNPVYEWKGITRAWRFSKARMEELDRQGKIVYSNTGMAYLKRYLDESKGIPPQDIWDDIPMLRGFSASERLGYPTQKPESLLERIIKLSTNEGDIVFDCFCGSGTTQAVAMKLGRRFIGADINLGAIQLTTKRLITIATELVNQSQPLIPKEKLPTAFYSGFEIYNVNNYDIFRNPVQAKELLVQALEVNPLPTGSLFDGEKDGRMVKIMPINRIATRQDLNELITGFDYKTFEQRQREQPNQPVEKVTLVCMGHEPDLKATLQQQMDPYKLDIEIVDILRDKQDLHFKRDAEANVVIKDGYLIIEQFFPLNLLSKLSEEKENVTEWRELVDSVMIDWNYDGAVLQPAIIDVPEGNALVSGRYQVPEDAGTIRVKITDLLSESLEVERAHG